MMKRKRTNKSKLGSDRQIYDSIRKPTAKPSRTFNSDRDVIFRKSKYKEKMIQLEDDDGG